MFIIDALGRNLLLAPLVSHTNGVAITSIVTVVAAALVDYPQHSSLLQSAGAVAAVGIHNLRYCCYFIKHRLRHQLGPTGIIVAVVIVVVASASATGATTNNQYIFELVIASSDARYL